MSHAVFCFTRAALVVATLLATPVLAQTPTQSNANGAPVSQVAPAPASELLAKARAEAGKHGKRVFVRFTASWCGWCHKMEKVLDQPAVAAVIRKHYVFVTLDVLEQGPKKSLENPGGEKVMNDLGGAGQGIPFFAALSAKGEKLLDSRLMPGNQNIGCPATPEEIAAFGTFLTKTAPRMTETERKTVLDAFTAAAAPARN